MPSHQSCFLLWTAASFVARKGSYKAALVPSGSCCTCFLFGELRCRDSTAGNHSAQPAILPTGVGSEWSLCESSFKKRCQLCLLKWIQCRIAFDKVLQCEEGFTRHVCCQRFGIIALVLRIHCTVKLLLHWTCARYWYKFEKVFKHANAHVCDDAVCGL